MIQKPKCILIAKQSIPRTTTGQRPPLPFVRAEEHEREEREECGEHEEHAALLRLVAVREEVAEWEEDEAHEEVGDPYAKCEPVSLLMASYCTMYIQLSDSPIDDSADTAYNHISISIVTALQ